MNSDTPPSLDRRDSRAGGSRRAGVPGPPSGAGAWLASALAWALALELAIAAGLLLLHQWQVVRFPYPLDYGEGPLLDHLLRLAHGENPYPADLASAPYHIAVYAPLFPALQVPFFWLFGPALWYGRALSVAGLFLASLASGLTVHALTRDRFAAWVAAGLLLASPFALYWSPLARVDSLALGLGLLGLYFGVRAPGERRDRLLAALCFVAAAYTRQSAVVAAPLAAFVFNAVQRGPRPALELAGWTAVGGLSTFGVLLLATSGGFWSNAIGAHGVAFRWTDFRDLAVEAVRWMPGLLLVLCSYLVRGFARRDPAWFAIGPFAMAALLVSTSGGKFGSSVNYLLEPVAAMGLAAAALLVALRARPALRALLLLALVVQVPWLIHASRTDYAQREMWKLERRDEIERLADHVRHSDGAVVADEFMALIPLSGKRLAFQPFAFSALAAAGHWDEAPLVEALRRGDFGLLLLYQAPDWNSLQTRWTPAMLEAIQESYALDEELAHTLVARPGANATRYRRAQDAGAQPESEAR